MVVLFMLYVIKKIFLEKINKKNPKPKKQKIQSGHPVWRPANHVAIYARHDEINIRKKNFLNQCSIIYIYMYITYRWYKKNYLF